jgi:hypothetical protein
MGASATLVSAAAVMLFVVSAVFALGSSSGTLRSSPASTLVLEASAASDPDIPSSHPAAPTAVVLRAPAPTRPRPRSRGERPARTRAQPAVASAPATRPAAQSIIRRPEAVDAVPRSVTPAPAAARVPLPHAGDAVRRVGDDLSSATRKTGTTLATVAEPLGPPVSQAVQDVLDRLAITLKQTTDGLGGTLDKVLAKKE